MLKQLLLSTMFFVHVNNLYAFEIDKSAEKRLYEKIQQREPLSPSDEKAQTEILQLLTGGLKSNTLYQSPNVSIEYNPALNIFEVEIKTINIILAKEEANQWFLNHELSQQVICNYPVEFYLNWEVRTDLSNSNIIFSPLAPNCQ